MPVGVLFACASTSVPKRRQLIDVVSSGCKPPFSYGPNIRSRTFMLYKSDVAFLQLEENMITSSQENMVKLDLILYIKSQEILW